MSLMESLGRRRKRETRRRMRKSRIEIRVRVPRIRKREWWCWGNIRGTRNRKRSLRKRGWNEKSRRRHREKNGRRARVRIRVEGNRRRWSVARNINWRLRWGRRPHARGGMERRRVQSGRTRRWSGSGTKLQNSTQRKRTNKL